MLKVRTTVLDNFKKTGNVVDVDSYDDALLVMRQVLQILSAEYGFSRNNLNVYQDYWTYDDRHRNLWIHCYIVLYQ